MIVFVRHGQTVANRDGRLQGRIDLPLSELGEAQARLLADGLRDEPIGRIVSSPLQRATATAAAIAQPHGLDVEVDARLVELDYGEWDGRPMRDIAAGSWSAWRADPAFAPPRGESLVEVTRRVVAFCTDVAHERLVVAVSHVSPIKAAVCAALEVDERASWRMHLDVASATTIDVRPDGGLFLRCYNDTSFVARRSGG